MKNEKYLKLLIDLIMHHRNRAKEFYYLILGYLKGGN